MEAVDFRGKQKNILRLWKFDKLAFIHMLFYRVLVILGLITGIITIIALYYNNSFLILFSESLIVICSILFIPHFYFIFKVFEIGLSNGAASGNMNESFLVSSKLKKWYFGFFKYGNYLAIIIWVIFIILFIKMLI